MVINKRILLSLVWLLSSQVFAGQLTKTYSCDTCDYDDAYNIAQKRFKPIACTSGSNGMPTFDDTFQCNTTLNIVIVANPISSQAFKFEIEATNHNQYTDAVKVTVKNKSINANESAALRAFYEIDKEFRDAINGFSNSAQNLSSSRYSPSHKTNTYSTNADNSCNNHPSVIFKPTAEKDVLRELTKNLARTIVTRGWNDVYEEVRFNGAGVQISADAGGADISWEYNNLDSFVKKSYGGTDNKLIYKVLFVGNASASGERELDFRFELDKAASRVDGFPLSTFMGGGGHPVDLTQSAVSNCLLKNIESIAQETIFNGGGTGSGETGGNFEPDTIIGTGVCIKRTKYTPCSTTMDGVRQCTENSIQTKC